MADSPRILELRRRVQADPASIAFAQLAEECRRIGSNEEAVDICRAGLARNPGYLSARITLGRALTELGQLDAAKAELDIVVAGVPDNLAAIRGLAEILQRRGQMSEALEYYKRALELAKHDPDLEDTVERISQEVAPAPKPQGADPHVSIEEIFNFDKLIDQLGLSASAAEGGFGVTSPELVQESPTSEGGPAPSLEELFADPVAEPKQSIELTLDDSDSLAIMERELRELEQQRELERHRALEEQQRALEQQLELERQRVREEQQRALEEQLELERQRVYEEQQRALEQQLELERQRVHEEQQRAFEQQRALEEEQRAREQQRALEEQRALEQQRALEGQRALEQLQALEEQRELERQRELEEQRELEQQREFERQRELEQQRAEDEQRARVALAQRRRAAQIGALENWLSAIVADRERSSGVQVRE